jgi:hypothetical protein
MTTRRPDVDRIMSGLKDFQRHSVDYVFQRLYGSEDPVQRFLVADEVGLGKTMVARGLIARVIDHLWDSTSRIDIIYICSNGAIARQNINKLNIDDETNTALATRITLLPELLPDLTTRKLNFVSFTPSTSFNLKSSLGRREERVLLYELLRDPWHFRGSRPANVFRGNTHSDRFRWEVDKYKRGSVDETIRASFVARLKQEDERRCTEGKEPLEGQFARLSEQFLTSRTNPGREIRNQRAHFIGTLRALLAETCLRSLEPDLIILDEFQRFKHLLDEEDEASQLARGLFNYSDAQSHARVLLLSATPYKMYTVDGEAGGDDHCADFLATLRFLQKDASRTERTGELLQQIRRDLLGAGAGDGSGLGGLTRELEQELRRVMVRTERLAVTDDRDGMLRVADANAADLRQGDIADYLSLAKIATEIEHHEPMEYWKSAPYLLNFMDRYQFKELFEEACGEPECLASIRDGASTARNLLLDWDAVTRYQEIDPANARLRWLLGRVVASGAWRLLWLPPAAPSRKLEGPFANPDLGDVTKTLIFSAWQVVPKVVSALTSHAVERQIAEATSDGIAPTRLEGGVLRLGQDRSASTFGLLYPSVRLAQAAAEVSTELRGAHQLPSSEQVLQALEEALAPELAKLAARGSASGEIDERWYWLAPVLLDAEVDRTRTLSWLESGDLNAAWELEDDEAEDGGVAAGVSQFLSHLPSLVRDGPAALGAQPADLPTKLAKMALGSPAVAALRALAAVSNEPDALVYEPTRAAAAQVAWGLRHLLNSPEATGIVRGNAREPYWMLVLNYAISGCLDDVLAEYAHVLVDWRGVAQESPDRRLEEVSETMASAIGLRAGAIRADELDLTRPTGSVQVGKRTMRGHFATRLAVDESDLDEAKGTERLERVSKAFNSPFWPFVLTTTSIGQEGLDFHLYCHAVAHWNLPSNPVDLEQREGRVHRFKGHAVRKNLARRHGDVAVPAGEDRWAAMFQAAHDQRAPGVGDLVPYWVYTAEGGSAIERHLPFLPLSRDTSRYEQLKDSLAIYRMVFGQPRQEDLLEYLRKHVPEERLEAVRRELMIDLSPPATMT